MAAHAQLRERYARAGQEHVFTFFDTLQDAQQKALVKQLESIDPERAVAIYRQAVAADEEGVAGKIEPPPRDSTHSLIDGDAAQADQWHEAGIQAIREGKVAVLLMAGGQGTRLGSSAPKGCFDIGLPSHKSLFQLQAERIEAVGKLAGRAVPWYIMTSGPTRQATEDFFDEHDYFGLERDHVIFFEQGVLPAFDQDGKILLDSKSALAVAPDGNGGLYPALRKPLSSDDPSRTVLTDLRKRGITSVHAYCVDNCLVRLADSVFMGCCITANADCGNLVVPKLDPDEKTGIVAKRDGKWSVIEYSEIPHKLAAQPDEADPDKLAFRASNIANHYFSLDFLESVESFGGQMPYHVARKKVPFVDLASGQQVKPDNINAIKLEAFVFDVFPFAQRMAILENARAECFSPLKNKAGTGADDPETSRRDLLAQQKRWIEAAGADLDGNELELAPCVSLAGEGLESIEGKRATRSGVVSTASQLAAAFS